jgi:alkanesulfonate monooxygenase SsuD/methylene tetrahydromethanopterin reductase-like flavin-dependent oxidoreductase (luciferase family)
VAKSIFVADDDKTARDYVMSHLSPYRQYYGSLVAKLKKNGRSEVFKTSPDMADDAVTPQHAVDHLVIWGSPKKVIDELLAFRDEIGDFGTLLYAGKDWRDRTLSRSSMILTAEKVLPAINAAIGADRSAAR